MPTFIRETNELYLKLIAGDPNLDRAFDRVREEYMTNSAFFLHDNKAQIEQKLNLYINNRKLGRRIRNRLKSLYAFYKYKLKKDQ